MSGVPLPAMAMGTALMGLASAYAGWSRLRRATLPPHEVLPLWRLLVHPVAKALQPGQKDKLALANQLIQAGRTTPEAMSRHLEERALGVVVGLVLALALFVGGASENDLSTWALSAALCLLAGIWFPRKRLEVAAQTRRDLIAAHLPGTVDLLTTAVDAGLSMEHAIRRISEELTSAPALAAELRLTANECAAGVPLSEALRRLGRRVALEDLSTLCAVIAQSYELGAPIVRTLSEFNDNLRKLRMAALDEHAGKVSIKLTMPLALFLLPAMLLVMLGPPGLQLMRFLQ